MRSFFSGIVLFLVYCSAYAQRAMDEGVNAAPADTVDVIWVVLFGVVFVGMIAGFFWYMWINDRKHKPEESKTN
ncbi:MAG: hypothetical protein FJY54_03200 [Betaproteobacteria bacterium]|nr:hypothetical protein [Betaproteobacteria bacterium]